MQGRVQKTVNRLSLGLSDRTAAMMSLRAHLARIRMLEEDPSNAHPRRDDSTPCILSSLRFALPTYCFIILRQLRAHVMFSSFSSMPPLLAHRRAARHTETKKKKKKKKREREREDNFFYLYEMSNMYILYSFISLFFHVLVLYQEVSFRACMHTYTHTRGEQGERASDGVREERRGEPRTEGEEEERVRACLDTHSFRFGRGRHALLSKRDESTCEEGTSDEAGGNP